MLTSLLRQQPDLFDAFATHWQAATNSSLLLYASNGERLASSADAPILDWAELRLDLSTRQPVALRQPMPLLLAPLYLEEQPVGYLVAAGATEQALPVFRWSVDMLQARLADVQAMQSMTDELINAWDQLSLIYRVAGNIALSTDLTSILRSILLEIKKVTQTEDTFMVLRSEKTLRCVSALQRHENQLCNEQLLDNMLQLNRPLQCDTSPVCHQVWPDVPPFVKSLLLAPLTNADNEVQAVIGLLNKSSAFTASDSKLLAALIQYVITIIENQLTHRRLINKERLSRELEIAAEIQESLLPTQLPQLGGLSMSVSSVPASEVGGDFYDFVTLDDQHLTLVVGDVSGKGIPAAMLTSVTRTMLRVEATRGELPHKIIQQANSVLYSDLSRADSFVTAFVATINTQKGQMTYASAGHTPTLLWRADTGRIEQLRATDLPIGIVNQQENNSRTVALKPGDTLVFYTDGITEAQSSQQELFGIERLTQVVRHWASESPERLQQQIQADVNSFRQQTAWHDDATLLILKILGRADTPYPQPVSTVIKSIDFLYPADMEYLSDISQQIADTCRQLTELPMGTRGEDFIYLIELAISEICTNIVKHAYANSEGNISGQVTLLNNGVQLDFYDQGLGFDPNTVPEPDAADRQNLREGGYGLHIVRQIMDVVSYESQPDQGNHWHLIKFLPP